MTASTAPALAADAPPLRRLPVPLADPPYDDERGARAATGSVPRDGHGGETLQGTLALAFVLPSGVPATPQAGVRPGARPGGPRLRLVGGDDDEALDGDPGSDEDFGPQATPRAQLPEPRDWAARLVQALVEVQAGDRPASQLVRWTSEEVYAAVARQAHQSRGARRPAPRAGVRPIVRSVHVCEPADGVAEACALVQRGTRASAVALRMEGVDGRWRCTALELG